MKNNEIQSLTRFGAMAKSHWETHRPRMVDHLKRNLVYLPALLNAQEQAKSMVATEVRRGNDLESAREMALRMFILLPSELEQKNLEVDRMPFSQPDSAID